MDQFLKKAEEVAIPRTLCAVTGAPSSELAPDFIITSRSKNEIPFFDITLDGALGEANRQRGRLTKDAVQ